MTAPRSRLHAAAPWVGLGLTILSGFLVCEGPNRLHDWREARRIERDLHVEGTVTGLRDTGEDNHDEPLVEVSIAFTTREGGAVATRTMERMNAPDVVWLWSHKEIDVWYDPNNPLDAVIRWRSRMAR